MLKATLSWMIRWYTWYTQSNNQPSPLSEINRFLRFIILGCHKRLSESTHTFMYRVSMAYLIANQNTLLWHSDARYILWRSFFFFYNILRSLKKLRLLGNGQCSHDSAHTLHSLHTCQNRFCLSPMSNCSNRVFFDIQRVCVYIFKYYTCAFI